MSQTAPRKPKHQEILDTLLHEIDSGKYTQGEQLPTEFALAERFQVSRPTVARAVQELGRRGLVRRRAGHGTFVLPRVSNDRMVFGLLVPELGDSEIFEPICGHIARFVQRSGHAMQWAHSNPASHNRQPAETAAEACRDFIDGKVSGVFLAPFVTLPGEPNPNRAIVQRLERAGIPVVLMDRDIVMFPKRSSFDLVAVDHLRGQARLTEHLIEQGHRRFVFWVWPNAANTIELRSAGIYRAMMDAGMTPDEDFIQRFDPDDAGEVARLMEEQQPDAILCANDVFAGHLMKTLEQLNIRVPEDVSVAGYDDVRYAHLLRVPLTTISQPCEQIGYAAVQVMMERIRHPDLPAREILVTPDLAIRDSTAAVDSESADEC